MLAPEACGARALPKEIFELRRARRPRQRALARVQLQLPQTRVGSDGTSPIVAGQPRIRTEHGFGTLHAEGLGHTVPYAHRQVNGFACDAQGSTSVSARSSRA